MLLAKPEAPALLDRRAGAHAVASVDVIADLLLHKTGAGGWPVGFARTPLDCAGKAPPGAPEAAYNPFEGNPRYTLLQALGRGARAPGGAPRSSPLAGPADGARGRGARAAAAARAAAGPGAPLRPCRRPPDRRGPPAPARGRGAPGPPHATAVAATLPLPHAGAAPRRPAPPPPPPPRLLQPCRPRARRRDRRDGRGQDHAAWRRCDQVRGGRDRQPQPAAPPPRHPVQGGAARMRPAGTRGRRRSAAAREARAPACRPGPASRLGRCAGLPPSRAPHILTPPPQVFLTPRDICIAMEYASGGTLFNYVSAPLAPGLPLALPCPALPACLALALAGLPAPAAAAAATPPPGRTPYHPLPPSLPAPRRSSARGGCTSPSRAGSSSSWWWASTTSTAAASPTATSNWRTRCCRWGWGGWGGLWGRRGPAAAGLGLGAAPPRRGFKQAGARVAGGAARRRPLLQQALPTFPPLQTPFPRSCPSWRCRWSRSATLATQRPAPGRRPSRG
jgi:hypothetical protein